MSRPTVNLDELRAATLRWQLIVDGRTYTARPVSVEQVIAYQAEIIGASPRAILRARRRLLRLAFPWRDWRPSWIWRGDPVDIICAAPAGQHEALMASFFASLRSSPLPLVAQMTTPSSNS